MSEKAKDLHIFSGVLGIAQRGKGSIDLSNINNCYYLNLLNTLFLFSRHFFRKFNCASIISMLVIRIMMSLTRCTCSIDRSIDRTNIFTQDGQKYLMPNRNIN